MARHQRLGQFGEEAAASWYQKAGYRIVHRNWRCRQGEIDLIAASESSLVFVEVKTRSSPRFGSGFDAVDARKRARVRRLAAIWLSEQSGSADSRYFEQIRFDVVDVDGRGNVNVAEGCF